VSHNPLENLSWEQCVVSASLDSTTSPSSCLPLSTADSSWQGLDFSNPELFASGPADFLGVSASDLPPISAFGPRDFANPEHGISDSLESIPTSHNTPPVTFINHDSLPAFDTFNDFTEPMTTHGFSQQLRSSSSASASTPSSTSRFKLGRKRASSPETETHADKRRRNNVAAAKYRQKKLDRISELEQALKDVSKERDE